MNNLIKALVCIPLLTGCVPGDFTPKASLREEPNEAKESTAMEAKDEYLKQGVVIDIYNHHLTLQTLGVEYKDEFNVVLSFCYDQGKPVNPGDTVTVQADNDIMVGRIYYYPPCEQ